MNRRFLSSIRNSFYFHFIPSLVFFITKIFNYNVSLAPHSGLFSHLILKALRFATYYITIFICLYFAGSQNIAEAFCQQPNSAAGHHPCSLLGQHPKQILVDIAPAAFRILNKCQAAHGQNLPGNPTTGGSRNQPHRCRRRNCRRQGNRPNTNHRKHGGLHQCILPIQAIGIEPHHRVAAGVAIQIQPPGQPDRIGLQIAAQRRVVGAVPVVGIAGLRIGVLAGEALVERRGAWRPRGSPPARPSSRAPASRSARPRACPACCAR